MHAADYTGTPGPNSSAAQTARFLNHPVRNALYLNLIYASLAAAHSQITGTATPGATLKITKDLSLYTAPIKQNTTPETTDPPQAIPDAPRVLDRRSRERLLHVGRQPVRAPRAGRRGRRRAPRPGRVLP